MRTFVHLLGPVVLGEEWQTFCGQPVTFSKREEATCPDCLQVLRDRTRTDNDDHEPDNPQGVWCCPDHEAEYR